MKIKRIVVGQLQTNCYVLASGGKAAVIDPGDWPQIIAQEIAKLDAKVEFIVDTHNHFDHIGGNSILKKKYGAKILIGNNDNSDGISADRILKEGDVLDIGEDSLKIVETPGHTKGSICLFGNGFVISGDTLFDGGFGRTDLPGGSSKDMAGSLEKLDCLIMEGSIVYPGHGDIFKYKKGMALELLDYLD